MLFSVHQESPPWLLFVLPYIGPEANSQERGIRRSRLHPLHRKCIIPWCSGRTLSSAFRPLAIQSSGAEAVGCWPRMYIVLVLSVQIIGQLTFRSLRLASAMYICIIIIVCPFQGLIGHLSVPIRHSTKDEVRCLGPTNHSLLKKKSSS